MLSIVLLMPAFLLSQASGAPAPLTADEVLTRWDAGVKLIDSYDLRIRCVNQSYNYSKGDVSRIMDEAEAATYPPSIYHSHIYRSGDKRRGEFGGDGDVHFRTTMIHPGQDWIAFSNTGNQVVVNKTIEVFGANEYEDYEAIHRTMFGDGERVEISRSHRPQLLPREGRIYVLDVPTSTGGEWPEIRWRVWLDPDRNFMPVKWMQWFVVRGIDCHDRDYEIDLKEVSSGVWAPIAALIRVYHKDRKSPSFGGCIGVIRVNVIEEKSKFNIPIPDGLFDATIPTGKRVVDRIRNVVYTQGAADPTTYLAHLAAEGKKGVDLTSVERRTPPAMVVIPGPARSWLSWRNAALGLGAMSLAFGASVLARRSIRRAA